MTGPTDDLVGKTLKGMTKSVLVEEDALTISFRALYHGFKGDKRIPYGSITSVQYMEPGSFLAGYLQLSIKGAVEWRGPVAQDENAILFDKRSDDFAPFATSSTAGSPAHRQEQAQPRRLPTSLASLRTCETGAS